MKHPDRQRKRLGVRQPYFKLPTDHTALQAAVDKLVKETPPKPCCACGYHGKEATECPGRADKTHCTCWGKLL
jgi:hypothetical protein